MDQCYIAQCIYTEIDIEFRKQGKVDRANMVKTTNGTICIVDNTNSGKEINVEWMDTWSG